MYFEDYEVGQTYETPEISLQKKKLLNLVTNMIQDQSILMKKLQKNLCLKA